MTEGWLYGWKQIAAHMGCDIKTAKIYHYRFGMPVLFGPGGGRIALPEQLTPWLIKFNRKLPANTLTRPSNLPKNPRM